MGLNHLTLSSACRAVARKSEGGSSVLWQSPPAIVLPSLLAFIPHRHDEQGFMGWGYPHNLDHGLILKGTHDSSAQTQGLCLEEDILADVACLYHGIPHAPFAIPARDPGILRTDNQAHGRFCHPHLTQRSPCHLLSEVTF